MFYKVILHGEAWSQAIDNTLYYRTGIGVDIDGLQIGGAVELANLVQNEVWGKMKVCLPNTYKLNEIVVYPMHDDSFDLAYQNPYTKTVLENGTLTGDTDGTAQAMIIRMNLEPTTILGNGIKPPKRGYIAVGPIESSNIDNSGHLIDAIFLNLVHPFHALTDALSSNLTNLVPPVQFWPIRVHQEKVLGLFKIRSYADISSCTLRRLTTYRRSRMAEA